MVILKIIIWTITFLLFAQKSVKLIPFKTTELNSGTIEKGDVETELNSGTMNKGEGGSELNLWTMIKRGKFGGAEGWRE